MLPEVIEKIYEKYLASGNRVCTDTRKIEQDVVFFCLKGDNFDGNKFVEEAIEKGALLVVTEDPTYAQHPKTILVNNALETLQQLAQYHCKNISTKILAVGGSNGKTTTKELCYTVLSAKLTTAATEGNLNNHIGVPLTLLKLSGKEAVAIVEMGTNHPGEMKVLCDLTPAHFGIITNIGKEHLEGFGSIEAVAREESEVYLCMEKNQGISIVNNDDAWLQNMSKRLTKKISIGIHNEADIKGKIIQSMPHLKFEITFQNRNYIGESKLGGAYNLYNVLFALASGHLMGLEFSECVNEIAKYSPQNNRSEWLKIGNKQILLDAYNANPSSMSAALEEFSKLPSNKCVLLGDMLELGGFADEEHLNILNLCKQLGFEEMYFSGNHFFSICSEEEKNKIVFENTAQLKDKIKTIDAIKSDWIFIKGSRGMKMEMVLN